ncbi:MAG: S26 family signal peptidase [Actinomycetota bacterium]|nr:S26 family signal peptidase [Actinomycetota bacterium]
MPAGETRCPRLWTGLSVVLAVVAFTWSSGPWRVAVEGLSMAPALLPGDRLLVRPARRPRRGDLVVIRDPSEPNRWVIKRVAASPGEQVVAAGRALSAGAGLVVLGDNGAHSTDSRHYGAVPLRAVHGRVWYRYAPAERCGRLPAR